MGRLKWFDRFLTNEIKAQNLFLSRRRRKNRFLRSIKEITSTMGLSPDLSQQVSKAAPEVKQREAFGMTDQVRDRVQ